MESKGKYLYTSVDGIPLHMGDQCFIPWDGEIKEVTIKSLMDASGFPTFGSREGIQKYIDSWAPEVRDFWQNKEYQKLIDQENELTRTVISILQRGPVEHNYEIQVGGSIKPKDYSMAEYLKKSQELLHVKEKIREIRLEILSKYYKFEEK